MISKAIVLKSKSIVAQVWSSLWFATLIIAFFMFLPLAVAAQPARKNTEGKADQNIKSVARVNPSTLAMELSMPLMSYPGRGGNSLPVAFNYSSKVWRMDTSNVWWTTTPLGGAINYYTDVHGIYAENSAAGWTSSLALPRIDEKLQTFDQHGDPYGTLLDEIGINSLFQSNLQIINSTNNNLMNVPAPCGMHCQGWTRVCFGGDCTDWACSGWNYHECGGGGGTWDDPDPSGGGNNEPHYMHYVKRVRVIMPNGSSHEFRKEDHYRGYCAPNNPNNGQNCEGNGDDKLGTFIAVDGSRMRLERYPEGSTLYLPNGSRYNFGQLPGSNDYNLYGTEHIDASGNRIHFTESTVGVQTSRKWTDTVGREIADPLPRNLFSQTQQIGIQNVQLPSFDGQLQTYKLKWLPLKSEGGGEGALEGLEQNPNLLLSYTTDQLCRGNISSLLPPTGSQNGVLFNEHESRTRICNPGISDGNNGIQGALFNPIVLAEILAPDGSKHKFKYNHHGEISKVIYPTGSYERFEYGKVVPMGDEFSSTYDQTNRGVKFHRIYDADNNLVQEWKYEVSINNGQYPIPSNALYQIIITAPDLTQTVRYLHRTGTSSFGFTDPRSGMAYEEYVYGKPDAGGERQLWRRKHTEWDSLPPRNNGQGRRDPFVKSETEYIFEGGGDALRKTTAYEYDDDLNVKKVTEYPYQAISTGNALMRPENPPEPCVECEPEPTPTPTPTPIPLPPPVQITETSYLPATNHLSSADGIYLAGLPILKIVKDGQNNIVAKSEMSYDDAAHELFAGATSVGYTQPTWTKRGRLTRARSYSNVVANEFVETHTYYDQYGNARKVRDANNKESFIEYGSQFHYAYPTKTVSAVPSSLATHGSAQPFETNSDYDLTTGLVKKIVDANGSETRTEYDSFLRPYRVSNYYNNQQIGSAAETVYGVPNQVTGQYSAEERYVKVKTQLEGNTWHESVTRADSLGRTIKTEMQNVQGTVCSEVIYQPLTGRVWKTTNPYRTGETKLWSEIRYDERGRAVETFAPAPDGQTGASLGITGFGISTVANFIGTYTVGTNAAGKTARSITNSLGQLIRVDEATGNNDLGAIATPNQATVYTYSPLGNMVKVMQGGQNRYFLYDSLGRLLRVRQPEQNVNPALNTTGNSDNNSWSAGFTYDNLGNVLTATDAKGVTINNSYDNLSRVITRSYTLPTNPTAQTATAATSTVNYKYDGLLSPAPNNPTPGVAPFAKGQLTEVSNAVSTRQMTEFDPLGRLTASQQITDGRVYQSGYSYNLSGAMVSQRYPSGRVVRNDFNADGNLKQINSLRGGAARVFANQFVYTAAGAIKSLKLGNGLFERAEFNNRLQITELALGTSLSDASKWRLQYEYGELNADGSVNTAKNTGNIAKQTVSFAGQSAPFVQSYRYDSLDRLTETVEKSGANQNWKQTFGYDRFGNRTAFAQWTGTTQLTQDAKTFPSIDPLTNRITSNGYSYDLNGNLIQDAENRKFSFNADNKQVEVRDAGNNALVGQYFYDGDGRRIKKINGLNNEITVFVYDAIGKQIAEYDNNYAPPAPQTSYTATDVLGSPRVITNQSGAVTSRRDFMPFGEELNAGTPNRTETQKYALYGNDNIRKRFTGYEKDIETGLDFAEARYYQNKHGRFTAVDPLLASGKSSNPQTFNRYVYVMGNPLRLTDKTGLQAGTEQDDVLSVFSTAFDKVSDAIKYYADQGISFVVNSDPLQNANHQRLQNRMNASTGDTEAADNLSRKILGFGGPTVDSVLQQTTDSYNAAETIANTGSFLSGLSFGAAGMVGSRGSSVTTIRGFSPFRGSSQGGSTLVGFGSDDAITENSANLIPKKGWFDAVVHGTRDGQNFTINGQIATPNAFYERMLQNGYQPGTRIRLMSCYAGSCPNGAAQQLSNLSGAQVVAPSDKVHIGNGAVFDRGKPYVHNGGRINLFLPR